MAVLSHISQSKQSSGARLAWALFCLAVFYLPVATTLRSQQDLPKSGAVKVLVREAQGRGVSGSICQLAPLSEPSLLLNAMTDEMGHATFLAKLPSGTYTLTIESPGFETFTKRDVVVEAGAVTAIEVSLTVAALKESVTITSPVEEATTAAAGSSIPAASLHRETLQHLPLAAARIDEALPLIPGVVRSPTGEISIEGATEQQSALLVNGLNDADPASGNFRLNLPIDSVESVQVFQHPYTAEYGAFTGGITKIQTRRGGDQWHVEFNDFLPDLRYTSGKIVGIAEDSPRFNFNGPLIKDRLFLAQSLSYTIAKQPVRGLTFPNNETKTESQSYFSQVDLLLGRRHTQTFTFGYFPQRDQFVNLDFFRPRPVTPNYKQKDFVFTVRDNYQVREGLLQSALSFKRFHANVWGQGGE